MKITTGIFALILVLNCAITVHADNLDEQLNAAYQKALATLESKKVGDAEILKWTELHWITYRDAEADLQAWLAGKSAPDKAARKMSLAQSTQTRLTELQHIVKDGTSGDYNAEDPVTAHAYATLRQAIIAKRNPELTAALILDQRAWLYFSDLQVGDDGYFPLHQDQGQNALGNSLPARRVQSRLVQLQADASILGVDISQPPSDADTAKETGLDRDTEISPDHILRIEQTYSGDPYGPSWVVQSCVVSNKTEQRALLPEPEEEATTGNGRGKPTVLISEYAISPDKRWIFRTQKFYHGMCGAYLYERTSGLNYELATQEPFDILAWKSFKKITQVDVPDVTQGGVVKFAAWGSGSLRISLNASKRLTFADVNNWLVDFDLKTKMFSVPADIQEHDHKAF